MSPAISPDGNWIAYRFVSNPATGRTDVYLARFPEGTKRVQISDNGGGAPLWSHKQDELFFTVPPGVMQTSPSRWANEHGLGPRERCSALVISARFQSRRMAAGSSPSNSRRSNPSGTS